MERAPGIVYKAPLFPVVKDQREEPGTVLREEEWASNVETSLAFGKRWFSIL